MQENGLDLTYRLPTVCTLCCKESAKHMCNNWLCRTRFPQQVARLLHRSRLTLTVTSNHCGTSTGSGPWSACQLDPLVSRDKTAEPIEMPFVVWARGPKEPRLRRGPASPPGESALLRDTLEHAQTCPQSNSQHTQR